MICSCLKIHLCWTLDDRIIGLIISIFFFAREIKYTNALWCIFAQNDTCVILCAYACDGENQLTSNDAIFWFLFPFLIYAILLDAYCVISLERKWMVNILNMSIVWDIPRFDNVDQFCHPPSLYLRIVEYPVSVASIFRDRRWGIVVW